MQNNLQFPASLATMPEGAYKLPRKTHVIMLMLTVAPTCPLSKHSINCHISDNASQVSSNVLPNITTLEHSYLDAKQAQTAVYV